jgi:serpin B
MGQVEETLLVTGLVLAVPWMGACSGRTTADPGAPAVDCGTAGVHDLVSADTMFATAFLPPAVAEAGGSSTNSIVSPYSVSDAMMLVDVGAAGETSSQIESVLSLPGSGTTEAPAYAALTCALQADGSSNGNALYVANSLWGQQGQSFEAPFLQVLDQGYGAPLQTVDFEGDANAAAATINAWVTQATQGFIPSLFDASDVTPKTRLVVVNAIYFKGTWATGFDPRLTGPQAFTLQDGTQTRVTTMSGTIPTSVAFGSNLLVVELPYKGNALAMDILMPQPGSSGLAAFESTLSAAVLSAAIASLEAPNSDIVYLPKFSFTTRVELGSVLQGMGMTDAFEDGVANLSGMDGAMDLSVSAVVQQARVEVDEEGTVAAAATGASTCGNCGGGSSPPLVQIDHPFLFLIRDTRTGTILFMGQVVDPGQE